MEAQNGQGKTQAKIAIREIDEINKNARVIGGAGLLVSRTQPWEFEVIWESDTLKLGQNRVYLGSVWATRGQVP